MTTRTLLLKDCLATSGITLVPFGQEPPDLGDPLALLGRAAPRDLAPECLQPLDESMIAKAGHLLNVCKGQVLCRKLSAGDGSNERCGPGDAAAEKAEYPSPQGRRCLAIMREEHYRDFRLPIAPQGRNRSHPDGLARVPCEKSLEKREVFRSGQLAQELDKGRPVGFGC